ncbi:MAG: DUF559 domain-containing protein [Balneolaceae bacterium]|nr:DUF559 domain-containing protein [Balneolaceae bacterium]
MKFEARTVRNTINKAFLKEPIERKKFEAFKEALGKLLSGIEQSEKAEEREEHFKNLLPPFFKSIGFGDYKINTSSNIDLAIYTGSKTKDPLGVMMEVKRPSNKSEMISKERLNRKALHEAVLYYLEQRIDQGNDDLKHVIITDMTHWYIFDAQEFERCFYRPSTLRKAYKEWKENRKVSSNTDFMYNEIASFISESDATISGVSLPLKPVAKLLKGKEGSDYEKRLISLYKFFSPIHLLKEPFSNDSNSLNKEFYRELLYILGLEETKQGSTRYIQRAGEDNRHSGSIIENTIRILDSEDHLSTLKNARSSYGANRDEQLFSVAIELGITWMNRVLFLKLLEAQLYRYHRKDNRFKFLNYGTIDGLDELNKLFFQVLARKENDRSADVNEKFGHIPFLNSSLFDVSSLEHQTTRISGLDDHAEMPVYSKSVLTDTRGKTVNTLDYLFRFLEAYDFSAEGSEEIRDESKSLINASVLGLIFEKINGYKDGSFYTPGFITEYMARETLRKAVVDKFVEAFSALSPSPLTRGRGVGERAEKGDERGMSASEPLKKLPESLLANARHLRKNQTDAEELMWQLLRKKQLQGLKFRRQHPIEEGFILDFYCHEKKLAVELDGAYHNTEDQRASDEEREQFLNDIGVRVIRFSNEEVMGDVETVLKRIASSALSPAPLSRVIGDGGEGEKGQEAIAELTFTEIYNRIGRDISIAEANKLINSITICDPAVGSGHFLVSCLNELLAIKSELGILCDEEGKVLRDVTVEVENDELIVSQGEELFEYDVSHTWSGTRLKSRKIAPDKQRIQKTLFREKKHLIENCLFGVDINPNSVKICRLRLWIELLKRAYYSVTPQSPLSNSLPGRERTGEGGGHLEVLPNIDINIKQGNSLVSRFELDSDLSTVFKNSNHSLEDYKEAVRSYKQTGDRNEKADLQKLIDNIKDEYTTTLTNLRPINQKLSKARGRMEIMQSDDLFGEVKFSKEDIEKQKKKLKKLEVEKAGEESGTFYNQAFEWRFEFPEVLDDDGEFTGFDVVIGNPPYIQLQKNKGELGDIYSNLKYETYFKTGDIYCLFYERSWHLLRDKGMLSFITPNTWLQSFSFGPLRKFLVNRYIWKKILLTEQVFDEAVVDTHCIIFEKGINTGICEIFERVGVEIVYSHFVKNESLSKDGDLINIEITNNVREIYDRIIKENKTLDYYCNVFNGVKPFERGKGKPPQTKEIMKSKPFVKKGEKPDNNWQPLLRGSLIQRYENLWDSNYWIKYGEWLAAPRNSKIFEADKKIVVRQTGDGIIATLIGKDIICRDNLHIILLKNSINLKFCLGILNSKLIDFIYSILNPEKGEALAQVKKSHLVRLPIATGKPEVENSITSLVSKVLEDKKQNPEADTSKLEAEIDRLVYELYGLSEEEIGVVEGNIEQ